MERVIITRSVLGLCGMQVCAVKDATNDEILKVCNAKNPSGTGNGWSVVIRKIDESNIFMTKDKLPVVCDDDKNRLHFIILC